MSIQLTFVVENSAEDAALATEHGLSVLISTADLKLLFDTGATPQTLEHNASHLGVDLSSLDGLAISHGHHDHTGGAEAALRARPGLPVYAHPDALLERYADRPPAPGSDPAGKPARMIGWSGGRKLLADLGAAFQPVRAPQLLSEEIMLSGPIGGPQPQHDRFLVQTPSGMRPDVFEDEVFAMIRGSHGWAVLTGCCHRGLPNTLRTARDLARGERIAAVIGGLHLGRAGVLDLAEAADALAEARVGMICPCHCTGAEATAYLRERFGRKVHPVAAGSRLEL